MNDPFAGLSQPAPIPQPLPPGTFGRGNPYTFSNRTPVYQSTRLAQPQLPGPTLRAPPRTLGQMVQSKVADAVAPVTGQRFANNLADLVDYTPVGAVTQGFQFGQDLRNSNWGSALANGVGTALNVVPDAGPVAHAMFLGALAKGADKAALKRAEGMFGNGASREDIWNNTGWFKGVDGQWRYEISDHNAAMRPNAFDRIASGEMTANYPGMPAVMRHPELYASMPQTQSFMVRGGDLGNNAMGSFSPLDPVSGKPTVVFNTERPMDDKTTSFGLHEIQHGIQDIEGFARGGNPDEFRLFSNTQHANDALVLKKLAQREGVRPSEAVGAFQQALGRKPSQDAITFANVYGEDDLSNALDVHQSYRRLAGEVEARNVQTRMGMTPQQRVATPPWATEDVAPQDQIIRFGGQ